MRLDAGLGSRVFKMHLWRGNIQGFVFFLFFKKNKTQVLQCTNPLITFLINLIHIHLAIAGYQNSCVGKSELVVL